MLVGLDARLPFTTVRNYPLLTALPARKGRLRPGRNPLSNSTGHRRSYSVDPTVITSGADPYQSVCSAFLELFMTIGALDESDVKRVVGNSS